MVRNLINNNGNATANQFIINTTKAVYFQSYLSVVCKVDGLGITLSRDWDYSNTTRKYVYQFLNQMGYYCFTTRKDVLKGIENGHITLVNVSSLNID